MFSEYNPPTDLMNCSGIGVESFSGYPDDGAILDVVHYYAAETSLLFTL